MKKFNFCIAQYWQPDSAALSVYTHYNSEVHYGKMKHAKKLLERIKKVYPNDNWMICKVKPVGKAVKTKHG